MTLTKTELEQLAYKYQVKADKAYRNYQETGITRYSTAHRDNEDLADALRMAADAADEHQAYFSMQAQMMNFAAKAQHLLYAPPDDAKEAETDRLLKNLVSYGKLQGLIGGSLAPLSWQVGGGQQ